MVFNNLRYNNSFGRELEMLLIFSFELIWIGSFSLLSCATISLSCVWIFCKSSIAVAKLLGNLGLSLLCTKLSNLRSVLGIWVDQVQLCTPHFNLTGFFFFQKLRLKINFWGLGSSCWKFEWVWSVLHHLEMEKMLDLQERWPTNLMS